MTGAPEAVLLSRARRHSLEYGSQEGAGSLQRGQDRLHAAAHGSGNAPLPLPPGASRDGEASQQPGGSGRTGPWQARSPRPYAMGAPESAFNSEAAAAAAAAEARAMGSPIKLKLPGIERTTSSCSSRGGSPARWKPAGAPGSLSPLTGLPAGSPAASATHLMLRQALSARGMGASNAAGLSTDAARSLQGLQDGSEGGSGLGGIGSPAASQHSVLLGSSAQSPAASEPFAPGGFRQAGWAGGGPPPPPGSSGLGPRGPSGGGFSPHLVNSFGCSREGGGGATGVESPSRPRRAVSAPGNHLIALAVQHATQQAVAAGGDAAGGGSSTNSPHTYGPGVYSGGRPTLNLSFLSEEGGAGPCTATTGPPSSGPTPGSCETPGSDFGVASPLSLASSMQDSPHYQASRLGWKPRAVPASSGGSATSCCTPPSSTSAAVQPHPPPSAKKAAKQFGGAAPPPQQQQLYSQPGECIGSPIVAAAAAAAALDSPRVLLGGGDGAGGGSTAHMRRRAYSHSSHGGAGDGLSVVGSLGSGASASYLHSSSGGGSSRAGLGALPLLSRSSSGLVSAAGDGSSNPNSPVGMLLPRMSSSSGGGGPPFLLGKQDSAPFVGFVGGPGPGATPLELLLQQQQGSAQALQQQLSARDSFSGGGGGGTSTPRSSLTGSAGGGSSGAGGPLSSNGNSSSGGSIGGASVGGGAPGSGGGAACVRPSSGKKTVHLLVEAVRSRNDAALEELLAFCRSGQHHGLNDRHPTTDRTPLHEAVVLGQPGMVAMLLGAGSDPNVGHPKEGTPLLQAAAVGDSQTVELLLRAGADVAAVDVDGLTALHHALRSRHAETGRQLVRAGADLTARSLSGEAPMDMADRATQRAMCGGAAGGIGIGSSGSQQQQQPSPTGAAAVAAAAAAAGLAGFSGRASLDGRAPSATPLQQGSSSSSLHAPAPAGAGSYPGTPSAAARGAASAAAAAASQDASTPRGAAGGGLAATVSFASDVGSAAGGTLTSPLGPASGTSRSNSCNGLAAFGSSSASSSMGGSGGLLLRRQSSSGGGSAGLPSGPPSASAAGGAGQPSIMDLIGGSSGGIGSPSGGQQPAPPSSLQPQASLGASLHSGSSTPAAATPAAAPPGGSAGSGAGTGPPSAAAAGAAAAAAAGLSTPPISPSSVADVGPAGMRRPSPPVAPYLTSRGRSASGLSSDGGSGSGLPSALPSAAALASSCVDQQHPEERCPTPPVLELPERLRVVRKGRMRPALKGPLLLPGDTARRPAEDSDQGPPSALASSSSAAAAAAAAGAPGSSSACSSSLPTPAAGPGMPMQQQGSSTEVVTPTAVAAAASSSGSKTPSAAACARGAAPAGPEGGSSSGAPAAAAVAAVQHDLRALSMTDLAVSGAPGTRQQQQQAPAASPPAFKFGLDPGSSSTSAAAAGQAVAAAAAAAVATAAARHAGGQQQQQQQPAYQQDPLAQTFRLHLADSVPRELAQALQQQQQQRVGHDPRYPPLLQAHSPPDTPSDAASPQAAAAAGQQQQQGPINLRDVVPLPPGFDASSAGAGASQASAAPAAAAAAVQAPHPWDDLQAANSNVQWRRGELLGEGAYGKVWAGLNQVTGELMAVKSLQLVGRAGSAESAAQLAELKQELSLYQHLTHKHIVGYIGNVFDTATNTLLIFLEYVPGGSIASMLQRFGRFAEELAAKYTRQLLAGLEYLHGQQVVHRDLKGGNALVTRDGVVKLTDFGASKASGATARETDNMKSLRGSVFWMAPEVLTGKGYGRKADVWSLGCTVLEMLTGRHPWPEADNQFAAMMAISTTATGPTRPPGLSAAANDFLDHCFKLDPRERSTAAQLLQHPWVAAAASTSNGGGASSSAAAAAAAAAAAGGGAGSSSGGGGTRARATLASDEGPAA